VPLWMWGLVGYLSVVFVAALWAAVARRRRAIVERTRRLADAEPKGDGSAQTRVEAA
jgi:hypothetical protein